MNVENRCSTVTAIDMNGRKSPPSCLSWYKKVSEWNGGSRNGSVGLPNSTSLGRSFRSDVSACRCPDVRIGGLSHDSSLGSEEEMVYRLSSSDSLPRLLVPVSGSTRCRKPYQSQSGVYGDLGTPTMSDPASKSSSIHILQEFLDKPLVTHRVYMLPRDYGAIAGRHPCPHCDYFPDDLVLDSDAFDSDMESHMRDPNCRIHVVHNS